LNLIWLNKDLDITGISTLNQFIKILEMIVLHHFSTGALFMDYTQEDQCLSSLNTLDMSIYQLTLFLCIKSVLNFMDGIKEFHLSKVMKILKVKIILNI